MLGPLLVVGFYLIAIAFLWRDEQVYVARGMEINGEPLAVCPQCSYSLRGLREVRCPECGWSATVDEFLSNVIRQAADVS